MPRDPDRSLTQFLITMAIFAGVAIYNWLKRRHESGEPTDTSGEPPKPPPVRSPRPTISPPPSGSKPSPRKIDWEAELRRMLEGTLPVPQQPPELPRPQPHPTPPSEPPPLPVLRRAPVGPSMEEQDRGLPVTLGTLDSPARSYQQASQLNVEVSERLRQVGQQIEVHPTRLQTSPSSVEIAQALALVRNRRSLRAAVMVSVILGPPKSLQS